MIKIPFAKYQDMKDCISKNKDKKNPAGYCATIMRKVEGEKMSWKKLSFLVPIQESAQNNDDFLIKGIAINETTTRNNVKYSAEELDISAMSLRDKPILKDHINSVDSIIGRTTQNVFFDKTNKNIPFEGRIMDKEMVQKIKDGRVTSVSVGAMVKDLQKTEEGCMVAKGIEFVELSLVAVPADPNASFAHAMSESFKMKQQDGDNNEELLEEDEEIAEEKIKEMVHCPECEKEFNNKEDMLKHKKEKHKMEGEKMEELELLKKELSEAKTKIEVFETEKRITKAVEEAVKPIKEVMKKTDETKGTITIEEKKENNALEGFIVEKSETGKGMSIYRESYDPKFKKLNWRQ